MMVTLPLRRFFVLIFPVETLYTEQEILDMNIIFFVVVLLVLISAGTVYAVATIQPTEDSAGLYSKFKQDKAN